MANPATYSFARIGTSGVCTVTTNGSVASATITAPGSGGTNGTQTVTGTTGTGTKFQASVTVAGGAITAIIAITVAGNYTANPTNPAAEPVTGASLTGAQLNLTIIGSHGLTVGTQYQIWAQFSTASTAPIPTAGTYTMTVADANTFSFTANTVAGTNTTVTGALTWLNTGGATYTHSGTTITVNWPSHGFADGSYALLAFVGGSYATTGHDTNYFIKSVPNADTFTVLAATSAGTSGGVSVSLATVMGGKMTLTVGGRASFNVVSLQMRGTMQVVIGGKADFRVGRTAMGGTMLVRTSGAAQNMQVLSRVMRGTMLVKTGGTARLSVSQPMSGTMLVKVGGASPIMNVTIAATEFSARFGVDVNFRCDLFVQRDRYSVTDALDDAVKLAYYQRLSQMTVDKQERVIADLNSAMTLIFSRAGCDNSIDYFNQDVRTYTLNPAQSVFDVPADVESINGPVTLVEGNRVVRPLDSLSEVRRWPQVAPTTSSVPQVYYSNRSGSTGANGFTHALNFSPAPVESCDFTVEVSYKAPIYTIEDYRRQTPLAIPGNHASAILFPILRFLSQGSIDTTRDPTKIASVTAQYKQAMLMLGITDPIAPAAATGGSKYAKTNPDAK
jgi:hypothetical protein